MTMLKLILTVTLFLFSSTASPYQPAVVSAHKEASRIGLEILKKGGNSADAAIATAFALAVVEPYNSGLGGGGFFLYYDAHTKQFHFLDYREAAPQAVVSLKKGNKRFQEGILSVAVPGFLKGMEEIHKKKGKLAWEELVNPAVRLAEEGIPLRGKLKEKIGERTPFLKNDPALTEVFLKPHEEGKNTIFQSHLAKTLKLVAEKKSAVFYSGEIGKKIASFVKKEGGILSLSDLQSYPVFWRKPMQFAHGPFEITSSPIPSSGGAGLSLLFRKAIINRVADYPPYSPEAYQMLLEGFKDYFDYREAALGDSTYNVIGHTTHLSVIDAEGNMAAMTNTLNSAFGSGIMVPGTGIILNDEMADFSTNPGSPNSLIGGRRPLSSMAPTIVFKNKKPFLVIGTPGGLTIPQNIFQILYYSWQWKTSLDRAILQPKFYYSPYGKKVVAEEKFSPRVLQSLPAEGGVETKDSIGNVQALVIKSENLTIPLSDQRGEGKGVR